MAVSKKKGKPKESIVDTAGDTKPVYAVMTASSTINPDNKLLAKAIERAMGDAVVKSLQAGLDIVDDKDKIRENMLAARADIKGLWPQMSEVLRKAAAGVE